jgi:hemolysin activation/secretion protein
MGLLNIVSAGAIVGVVFAYAVSGALAQSGGPGVVKRAIDSIQRMGPVSPAAKRDASPIPEALFCSTLTARGLSDKSLTVSAVLFIDQNGDALSPDHNLPLDALQELALANLGPGRTYQAICDIFQGAKLILRDKGYIFTRVIQVSPTFAADQASITVSILSVTTGNVEVVEPKGSVGAVKGLLESYANSLASRRNPSIEDLERVSLLATDVPGIVRAMFVPSRGDVPGSINLSLQVERDSFHGFLLLNNEEAPTTGPGLAGVIGSVNSYSRFGDTTQLSAFNSFDFGDSQFIDVTERTTLRLDHQFFWGSDGLRFDASALVSWTAPGNELEPLGIGGLQNAFTLGLSYPVVRSRRLSVWLSAGAEWDDNTVDVSNGAVTVTDDSLRVGVIGGRLERQDRFGTTSLDMSVRQGVDLFNATSDNDVNKSRADGSAVFTSVRGEVSRDLALSELSASINEGFSLHGRGKFQWTNDPVLSYEEFHIGGDFVRGYEASEGRGDRGVAAYGELRLTHVEENPSFDAELQLYGFLDIGWVENIGSGLPSNTSLASGGGGIRLNIPQGPRLQVELALPISKDKRSRDNQSNGRILCNMIWSF